MASPTSAPRHKISLRESLSRHKNVINSAGETPAYARHLV